MNDVLLLLMVGHYHHQSPHPFFHGTNSFMCLAQACMQALASLGLEACDLLGPELCC